MRLPAGAGATGCLLRARMAPFRLALVALLCLAPACGGSDQTGLYGEPGATAHEGALIDEIHMALGM